MVRQLLCAPLALALAVVCSASLLAQDRPAADPDPAELEKLFKEFGKPGKEHEQLKRLVGTWKAEIKSFHASPEPVTSQGEATFRPLMGGRYVQQRFSGEMEGEKFNGLGISGYDNAQKKFVGTWIDDMGTGIMTTEGTYDEKTHTLTEMATSSSPIGEMKMKMVSKYMTDDKFLFTMYLVTPEGEQKMMEITYTRTGDKPAGSVQTPDSPKK